ncbi:MAG TPA: hypothetical protein VFQ53_01480 [Kofleriaceae bacterium]|nr:hypothetical protein [Kofleriaceae bacterium]
MRRLVLAAIVLAAAPARAEDALTILEVKLDRPTLHTAGIQVLISGDDNRNAQIRVRWRPAEGGTFHDGPPLFRVRPETVTARSVPAQLAGSIFDLAPGHTYEVELTVDDPDGGSETRTITVTTRALPAPPISPHPVAVTTADELRVALAAAQPGDVLELAAGTYAGSFALGASGTTDNPIVIRGAAAILDGENCDCNVLEISGSFVHVEQLTVKNAVRGIRFLGTGTTANVVSHVTIENVVHGIGSGVDQTDFTLCDNIVRGRLQWPLISTDDGAIHNDDQGIRVDGSGHVVCHNDISGFGDPMINFAEGGRAYDFYGNDIHEIYGDGTELDRAEGNVRLWGNRFTNVFTAISLQPIYGGPAYVLRNVALNVADEQLKLKSVGGTDEPSGVLIYHNSFVSPKLALNLQTPITQHAFVLNNNLFVGPTPPGGRVVDWTAADDGGEWDYNGYAPDGGFWFGTVAGTPRIFDSLAAAQAAGLEVHGKIASAPIFRSGGAPPASYTELVTPMQFDLDMATNVRDAGRVLPGINSADLGGPDLGAEELGCPSTSYGPRAVGREAFTIPVDCTFRDAPQPPPEGLDPTAPSSGGGCCGTSRDPRGTLVLVLLLVLRYVRQRAS